MCLPVHLVRHQLLSCENSTKAKNKSVHYISQTPPPPPPPCDHVYSRTSVCLCSERAPVAKFITRCSRARQLISMCWLRDRYVGRALEECARYLFSEKQRSRQGRKTRRRPTTTTARSGRPTYMYVHTVLYLWEFVGHWRTIRESRRTGPEYAKVHCLSVVTTRPEEAITVTVDVIN